MRIRTAFFLAAALAAVAGLFGYTSAMMSSGVYRMLLGEQVNVGNTVPKTGGAYSLLGSTGNLGHATLAGGRFNITLGTVNSWRPPQLNLSSAHVYPNPCRVAAGCTGITFTRLTLRAVINIFSVSGEKVATVEKNSNIDSVGWDLRNSAGSPVASGLYLYVVKGEGHVKKGKVIVVR